MRNEISGLFLLLLALMTFGSCGEYTVQLDDRERDEDNVLSVSDSDTGNDKSDDYNLNDDSEIDNDDLEKPDDSGDSGDTGNTGDSGNSGNTGNTAVKCSDNSSCDTDQFCKKPDILCSSSGECEVIPASCDDYYSPICGCDNKTYTSSCFANMKSENVFYRMNCLSSLLKGSVTFKYEKDGFGKETMSGGVKFDFTNDNYELLFLSIPTKQDNADISNVSIIFTGTDGVSAFFNIAFQRDPFKIPQEFNLEKTGANTSELKTDFGLHIGFLIGKLTVTKYQVGISGFVSFEMSAQSLSFAE